MLIDMAIKEALYCTNGNGWFLVQLSLKRFTIFLNLLIKYGTKHMIP